MHAASLGVDRVRTDRDSVDASDSQSVAWASRDSRSFASKRQLLTALRPILLIASIKALA